jgi:hypothetical protein
VKTRLLLGFDERHTTRGRECRGETHTRDAATHDQEIEHVRTSPDDNGRRAMRNDTPYHIPQ